jgi:hypothetical protein
MTNILIEKKLDSFSISLRQDGIIQTDIELDKVMEIYHIKLGVDFIKEIYTGEKFPLLFKVGDFSLPSQESLKYQANEDSNLYASAEAYVITSFYQKIIADFYLKINKPARPTKFFSTEKEAVKWLKGFL